MNVHSAFNKKALCEGKKEYLSKELFKLYIANYIFSSAFFYSLKKKKKTFKMSLARLHNGVTFIFKLCIAFVTLDFIFFHWHIGLFRFLELKLYLFKNFQSELLYYLFSSCPHLISWWLDWFYYYIHSLFHILYY